MTQQASVPVERYIRSFKYERECCQVSTQREVEMEHSVRKKNKTNLTNKRQTFYSRQEKKWKLDREA